ncbi:MAG: hypothetical protein ACRD24_01030 [Terriglobales bacterium]
MKRVLCWVLIACCALPVAWADRLQTSGLETNDFTATEWSITGSPTIQTAPVHSGTYAMQVTNGQMYASRAFTAVTSGTFWSRAYVYIKTAFGTSVNHNPIMRHLGAVETCRADFKPSTAKFRVFNNITTTAVEMTGTLSVDTWYRLELRDLLSDTVGECELRIYTGESTTALETLSITGQDTLSTNLSSMAFGNLIGANWSTGNVYLDDIAINKSTGTFQTSWPGPGKIFMVKPTSDNTVAWTKTGANCSATTNTDCVDDEPGLPDDLSGYNTIGTSGTADRFNKTALGAEIPSNADMILVDVYARFGASGSTGTRLCRVDLWDDAGAQSSGPDTGVGCDGTADTFAVMDAQSHLVFDLGSRSKATVDDADFDLGYTNRSAHSNRVTSLWANVEWTEAPPAPATTLQRRMVHWE